MALAPENLTVHTPGPEEGGRLRQEDTPLPTGDQVAAMLGDAWAALEAGGYAPLPLPAKFMSGALKTWGGPAPGYVNQYNICMMEELHRPVPGGRG